MKKILVTGSNGFIGKNLISELEFQKKNNIIQYNHEDDLEQLEKQIVEADFIFHLAGINRTEDKEEFYEINVGLTQNIVQILKMHRKTISIMFSSSVQSNTNTPYGVSKKKAEEVLIEWGKESGSKIYIYHLPNIFGKWSKPNYNSVIATFCYNIIHDLPIPVHDEHKLITLVYIDDLVKNLYGLLEQSEKNETGNLLQIVKPEYNYTVGELAEFIYTFRKTDSSSMILNFENDFVKKLYATYTSFLEIDGMSYFLEKKTDTRGWLVEFIKNLDFGQVFISKTKSGVTRGNHWHHTKNEKFLVVSGVGKVRLRNLTDTKIIEFVVSGEEMKVINIPTGYVHSITNIGEEDLITIFYANEVFDKTDSDTFHEEI